MDEKLKQAIQLRADNQFDAAKQLFEALLDEFPHDAQVHYHAAWMHDNMGDEKAAVPYYERAIELGLHEDELRGALLGLGSTYRTLGDYERSVMTLQRGQEEFPDAKEFPVFLAMALYNTGQNKEAVSLLLQMIVDVCNDDSVQQYKRAILLYAEDLDQTWN